MNTQKERKMIKMRTISMLLILAALLISGCDQAALARGVAPIEAESRDGVAIVYPQESAQFYVGDFVDIQAEVGDASGFSAAVLMVNDAVYRRDTFHSAVKNGELYQPWIPDEEGVFALQIQCETADGGQRASNVVNVYVGVRDEDIEQAPAEEVIEEEAPPQEEDEACPIPMATSTGYPFCRSGPGTAYNTITNLQPGQSFPITAVSGSGSWWEIAYNTSGGRCWVWDDLVTICGETDDIPVVSGTEKDAEEAPAEAPAEGTEPDDGGGDDGGPTTGPTTP